MIKPSGVALGAGLASALLFIVSAKGTTAATLIAYFTALPIILAALGFGHLSGLAGALVGSGTVTLALGPILGAFFALAFALPGWWLSYLALLARPAEIATAAGPPSAPAPLVWYPVGRIVTWAAALSSGAVLLAGIAILIRFGGYDAAAAALSHRLQLALSQGSAQPGADTSEMATVFVKVLPLAMAASSFLMLVVNLWLGGRISELSQHLRRPWPNVPDGFRLPKAAAVIFVVGVVPALTEGAIATAASSVAAALGMAFALQGLASAHVLTRGFAARRAILALIYLVALLIPVSLVALTLLGVVDCLFSFRHRRPPTQTPANPTGGQPWK
jgi:hypothetical protein